MQGRGSYPGRWEGDVEDETEDNIDYQKHEEEMMKIKIYEKYWQAIKQIDWPAPEQIFICYDPQDRLGFPTWAVSEMNPKLEHDLVQRGLFWEKDDALLFAKALNG